MSDIPSVSRSEKQYSPKQILSLGHCSRLIMTLKFWDVGILNWLHPEAALATLPEFEAYDTCLSPADLGEINWWKEMDLLKTSFEEDRGHSSLKSILWVFRVQRTFMGEKAGTIERQWVGSPWTRQGLPHPEVCLLSSSLTGTSQWNLNLVIQNLSKSFYSE